MKKLISLILAVLMVLSVSLAFAELRIPDNAAGGSLAGLVINATVGEYNENTKTFTVTLYEDDSFAIEDVEKLAAGDTLLAGGSLYKVKEKTEEESGDIMIVAEDGEEIVFTQVGDDHMMAQSTMDDRRYMHAFAVLYLPAAEGIVYEDNSNPEADGKQKVTEGLENILKVKAEKEENSIGFNFYATIIELNENMEIVRIHQDFDVAQ
jgi:outer membrane lipoprotein-sorting protein